MAYSRRLVHYGPGPDDFKSVISDRVIKGCWFELHRLGGCGAGEVLLKDEFENRNLVQVGDWIAFDYEAGDRWYFGRVENRLAKSPAGTLLRLEGMSIQLGEVFPGGFGVTDGDGFAPHRYAATDLFSYDPDRIIETVDSVNDTNELVRLLMEQYVVPQTDINLNLSRVESSNPPVKVVSHKFRGEESVRSIMKDLSIRTKNSSWGVDETGEFFFLQKRSNLVKTYQEGVDLVSLEETVDRETLFNRITLTGGYVYSGQSQSSNGPTPFYRWRGNYLEPVSRSTYGDRRIRIQVPWLRTEEDSRNFAREFFRVYSQPSARYEVEVVGVSELPRPWEGAIRLLDRSGNELVSQQVETVRIQFDHTPKLLIDMGPEDPRDQWPEPEYDDRWEIPSIPAGGGGGVTLTSSSSSLSESSSDVSSGSSSDSSSDESSDISSDVSSDASSDFSDYSSSLFSSESSSSESSSLSSSSSGSSSSSLTSSSSGEGSSSTGDGSSSSSGSGSESGPGSGEILLKDLFNDVSVNIYTHLMDIGESGPDTVGWESTNGTWAIDTTNDRVNGNTPAGYAYLLADSGQADVEVFADIHFGLPTGNGSTNAGILCSTRNNGVLGWLLWGDPKYNKVYIYQWASGFGFVRDSATVTLNYGSTYPARLKVVGTSIEGELGGVSVSYTAASAMVDTFCGLKVFESRPSGTPSEFSWFDNFYVYNP